MVYITLSLGLLLIFSFSLLYLYFRKFTKLKKTILSMYSYNRIGIINYNSGFTNSAQIHVEEIEKYKNGLSKLKIIKIDVFSGSTCRTDILKNFREVQETDKITWLERDKDLMEVRREKLQRLIK